MNQSTTELFNTEIEKRVTIKQLDTLGVCIKKQNN